MEEELTGMLSKLVDFVESASPVIWEAAQRQVVADIVSSMVWVIVCLILVIALVWLARWSYATLKQMAEENKGAGYYSMRNEDGFAFAFVSSGIGAVIAAIIFFALITDIAKMVINPTYYAIENILTLVE